MSMPTPYSHALAAKNSTFLATSQLLSNVLQKESKSTLPNISFSCPSLLFFNWSHLKCSRLEELEEETSRLRQKLDQVTPSASIERQPSNLPPPATPSEPLDSHTHPLSNKIDPPSSTPQDVFIYRRPNLSGANGGYPADRVIDGLRVDSQTIVDTFGLYVKASTASRDSSGQRLICTYRFYEYYAALMPVTDPAHSPDGITCRPYSSS